MRGTGEGRALTSGGGGDGVGEVLRDVDGVAGPAHLPRMRLSVRIPHVTGAYVDALSLSWPSLTRPLGSAHSPSALARSPRCRQCIEPPRPEPARHAVAASLADTGRRVAARTAPARPRLPSLGPPSHPPMLNTSAYVGPTGSRHQSRRPARRRGARHGTSVGPHAPSGPPQVAAAHQRHPVGAGPRSRRTQSTARSRNRPAPTTRPMRRGRSRQSHIDALHDPPTPPRSRSITRRRRAVTRRRASAAGECSAPGRLARLESPSAAPAQARPVHTRPGPAGRPH